MEKESYTRTELYDLLWSEPTTKVAIRLGISDVGLAKWCKQMNIPKPPLGYWAKIQSGKPVMEKPPLEPWWNEYNPEIRVRSTQKAIMEARLNKQPEKIPTLKLYKGAEFHPMIEKTFKGFELDKPGKFGRGSSKNGFNVQVGPDSELRIRRILQTLIDALAVEGYEVVNHESRRNPEWAAFKKGDELLTIDFYETSTKPSKPIERRESWTHNGKTHYYMSRIEYVPSGKLELKIRHEDLYELRTLKDSDRATLESQLGKTIGIFGDLCFDGSIARKERLDREEKEAAERQRLADIKWAKEVKAWKWGELKNAAGNWHELSKIRDFVEVMKTSPIVQKKNKGLEEWVSWAEEQINARDPIYKIASGMSLPGQNEPARGDEEEDYEDY